MILTGCFTFAAAESAGGGYENLGASIETQFSKLNVAGMAVAIVDENGLTFFQGEGYMNIREKNPVEADTIFLLASITKTITGVAVMQLAEEGEIDLDTDVNEYLPYSVRNPQYPKRVITVRMLLCHTSSVADNWDVMDQTYTYGSNPEISLQAFCEGYFDPNGKWYNSRENYLDDKPGACYEYSNCGYALLGHLVEIVAGQPFYSYCDENIFIPLGMNDTSLMLEDLEENRIAIPYAGGRAIEHYTFATYPDGGLRTSCEDFARFIAMMINGGSYQGTEILKRETVEAMFQEQYRGIAENQGITWDLAINELYDIQSSGVLIGHNGGEEGADTLMFFNPQTKKGAMIFINEEVPERRISAYNDLLEEMIQVVND